MRNHTLLLPCIALLGLLACSGPAQEKPAPDPAASPAEPRGEPVLGDPVELFNGSNLDNWTAFFIGGSTDPSEAFRVEDGLLKCKGLPIGYIRTRARYESFRLVVEWRFDPDSGGGNSGVLMRLDGPDNVWPRSIEAQLNSGDAGDIWNIGDFPMKTVQERVAGRRTRKSAPSNEKPLGQWNRYEITLDGGELELKVNGLVQNTATGCALVKGSIALQSEGVPIEFRKVTLRPITGHE